MSLNIHGKLFQGLSYTTLDTQLDWCVCAAGDRWHLNMTEQVLWAGSYCLCPGCNGTSPGECEECVPRTPGCDVLPPEYDCWMDVRTRESGWPIFDSGVSAQRY